MSHYSKEQSPVGIST